MSQNTLKHPISPATSPNVPPHFDEQLDGDLWLTGGTFPKSPIFSPAGVAVTTGTQSSNWQLKFGVFFYIVILIMPVNHLAVLSVMNLLDARLQRSAGGLVSRCQNSVRVENKYIRSYFLNKALGYMCVCKLNEVILMSSVSNAFLSHYNPKMMLKTYICETKRCGRFRFYFGGKKRHFLDLLLLIGTQLLSLFFIFSIYLFS